MDKKKLEKLQSLLKLMNESITKDDFVKSFGAVVKQILTLEKNLITRIDTNVNDKTDSANKELKELQELHKQVISKIEKDNESNFSNIKKWAIQQVGNVLIRTQFNQKIKELNNKIQEADNKLREVKSGHTPIKGKDYFDGNDGSPDSPIEVRDKLETLTEEERLDQSAVRGLEKSLKEFGEKIDKLPTRGGGGKKITYIKRENLSSQCNGTLKTFTLPKDTIDVLGVWGTQFPINFNPGTDWTFSGRTLTLTAEVSAPATGHTLYALVETLFYG